MAAQSASNHMRSDSSMGQYKELMARHQDLQQNKDKVEGTLISILLLTQITELKMLVDIGRQGHRLYDVVLALLVASVGALILVGLIVLYVGNLRYYRRRRQASNSARCCRVNDSSRFGRCSACCCRLRRRRGPTTVAAVGASRGSRLTDSYVCVPLGVTSVTAEGGRSVDNVGTGMASDANLDAAESMTSLAAIGCCPWGDDADTVGDRRGPISSDAAAELGCNRLDLLDTAIDEARARLAVVSGRLAALKAEHDARASSLEDDESLLWTSDGNLEMTDSISDASSLVSSSSFDQVLGGERLAPATRKSTYGASTDARGAVAERPLEEFVDPESAWAACRRQKESIESELAALEARRQRAVAGLRAAEQTEERAVFRAIMCWQHFTMYVLYFVCLMNIFITAFGIYSSSSGRGTGFGSGDSSVTP